VFYWVWLNILNLLIQFIIISIFCRFDEIKLSYKYLSNATNGFSDTCLIGAGGFGKVFKAKLSNQIVAIKRMEKIFEEKDFKQYLNEIYIVLKFKHDNLLPLLAISYDEQPCVVYEFMENGSLLDCIACKVCFLKNDTNTIKYNFKIN